jgi:5-methyltetrahydropteroyltriglutamate--homocysteine methyltransferase
MWTEWVSDRADADREALARAERAVQLFGPSRVLLDPDCGFATFADNPIASARLATSMLASIAASARTLRARHRLA